MATKRLQKRRKVWVNSTNDGSEGFHEENAYWSKGDALDQAGTYWFEDIWDASLEHHTEVAIPFVERLPGDVVLSREDVAELEELLAPLKTGRVRALAILRGGR